MKTIKPILKAIKSAGFSHLKVELEAQLRRGARGSITYEDVPCEDCTNGIIRCDDCDGEGRIAETVLRPNGRRQTVMDYSGRQSYTECGSCDGEGYMRHDICEGQGFTRRVASGSFGSDDYCRQWILDYVSDSARKALNYSKFYYDGSVDSEMTFTLAVEDAAYIVEFVEAFNAMSREIGHGIDVAGAGMHIAVLAEGCGGRYPVSNSVARLDGDGLENFMTEVQKLLPALFLAASGGNYSRPLRYRYPKISTDKYSAIHVMNGCMEFRLFETCYDRPEAVFEFLGTIAKTLEFYSDTSKKVVAQRKEFPFYVESGTRKFVETADQVRIIKRQLRYVLPFGVTVKEFESSRGVELSVTASQAREDENVNELKKLFKEHVKAFKTAVERPLTAQEQERLEQIRREASEWGSVYRNDEQMKAAAMNIRIPELSERSFIQRNLPVKQRSEVTVRV